MMKKLKNNAIASVQGIIYQNLVALETCFELLEGQNLYIEICGDVTIENGIQIETKHEQGNLTDLNHSFWKTISNWLDYDRAVFDAYTRVILLTTQKLSKKSAFIGFNEKDTAKKLEVLERIFEGYKSKVNTRSKQTLDYLNKVMSDSNRNRLSEILEKFSLITNSSSYDVSYNSICQTHASHLSEDKRKNYIDALIGFISNQIINADGKIDYESFTSKKQELTKQLISSNHTFPSTYMDYQPTNEEKLKATEYPFVKKIRDIEHEKSIEIEAIEDFYRQRKTVAIEMRGYVKRDYESYENSLKSFHKSKYRLASLNAKKENLIKDSQGFYFDVIASPVQTFRNYTDTPLFFRNGYLHELISENDDLLWKLKVND